MSGSGPFQDKPSLRVEALVVARGGRVLFEDLTFAVASGEYVEIRGANGSGKTSLLRAIAGYLKPKAGRIAIGGAEEAATALHYVGHQNALKGAADARAHVRYWARLFDQECDEVAVIERIGLTAQADLPARALSQGQARRLALARVAIGGRPILLLDEPAAALDARGCAILSALIEQHRAENGIALAAVHEPLGPAPSQTLTLGPA